MQRYFLEVMYNGTVFHGSQLQGDLPTVQKAVNDALSTLFREDIVSFGASRTDEGVHASANYYHFDTEKEPHAQLHYKLNALLPHAISVKRIFRCTDPPINARFDAVSRSYRYRIYHRKHPFYFQRALYYPYKIDPELLKETAAMLLDYEDFETFSKRNTQTHTFRCKIFESRWEQAEDQLHYFVRANRFLRGMVRGLVGTQLQVARGKMSLDDFRSVIESRDCRRADFSVTGHGLYLEHIEYPKDKLIELKL